MSNRPRAKAVFQERKGSVHLTSQKVRPQEEEKATHWPQYNKMGNVDKIARVNCRMTSMAILAIVCWCTAMLARVCSKMENMGMMARVSYLHRKGSVGSVVAVQHTL